MSRTVKRAFKYRCYPTGAQAAELARTFGCVRKVYNLALAARTEAWTLRRERVGYNATSAMLTAWKQTEELAFLNDVSSVPLQQALRHLQAGFANFFAGRARYPSFKSKKKSRRSAEYTTSAFRFRGGRLILAKMAGSLDIVWSRPLPEGAAPSMVTVSQGPDRAGPGPDQPGPDQASQRPDRRVGHPDRRAIAERSAPIRSAGAAPSRARRGRLLARASHSAKCGRRWRTGPAAASTPRSPTGARSHTRSASRTRHRPSSISSPRAGSNTE
ncbi:helix-turn-helix domain-containing protein [Dactylosporangium sp. NPDC048998]|uniref:RNA-guided endonuclease InsQ/TnpB family protein n=1 Tax=Dactylosporangium sp. NPDC048998 TaxID=3363976 RepID=UPI003720CEFB